MLRHTNFMSSWSPLTAIGAGFVGSILNSILIRITRKAGIDAGTSGFSKWLATHVNALLGTHVPVTLSPIAQEVFHTTIGVGAALIYAAIFYNIMRGPGWIRGLIFCQVLWFAQALIVLPWLGKGYFGTRISLAAPIWSWCLNAVYGIALGFLYRPKI